MRLLILLLMAALLLACEGMPSSAGDAAADEGPATIGALQGRGLRSPYEGREVAIHGIVTGNFVAGIDGFFMQDAAGADDGDPATSDGVFVQWTREQTPRVRRGDRVRVVGPVVELGEGERSVTAIAAGQIEVLGRGGVNVTLVDAPPAFEADWERHEGMWLRVTAPLTVTGNGGLIRFGELEAAFGGRLVQPTERFPAGPEALALGADNLRRLLVLDDNRRGEYPEILWFLADGLSHQAPLRSGSVLAEVEGVLSHRYGRWRLHLTRDLQVREQAPRPPPPDAPAGLRLASVNLHNFFNGDGRGRGFPTPRGAATPKEFERQRAKTVATLVALQPDVFAAAELENDGSDPLSAEAALLKALNQALGDAGDYRAVETSAAERGEDAIRVAIFYRHARMSPMGPAVALSGGTFRVGGSRPPLAQAFLPVGGGEPLVVVANHFKSKGSCPAIDQPAEPGDRDQGDYQACWNALRTSSAQRLHDWLQGHPTGVASNRIVLLGDFNAYAEESPMRLLRQLGWRDAFEVAGAEQVYSYVFNGQAGRLDHALVSPALVPMLSGAVLWHSNADESEAFDYRASQRQPAWYSAEPWRSSDHDPLMIGLDFSRRP